MNVVLEGYFVALACDFDCLVHCLVLFMGYVSLGLIPFDNTKVRQVFDTTKYFSKIIPC
nr:MAG TPA: hypothetical protein [Caudoviricetes sp.]